VCDALGIEPQALRRHLRALERDIRSGARSADSFRLRLKESNRAQHMTVNRERAHRRRHHSLAN
jgi:predicted ArsR family transcriptional regulator